MTKRLVKNFILKERRLNFPTEGTFRLFLKDAPFLNWRCAYRCVRIIFQKWSIFTAPWGAALCPVHRSALLEQSLTWRSLGRLLLAKVMRVRLGRLAAARARQPAVASSLQVFYNKKRTVFNKRVRPLSACAPLKTPRTALMPSLSRAVVAKLPAQRQILVRAKFAFVLTLIHKNLQVQKKYFLVLNESICVTIWLVVVRINYWIHSSIFILYCQAQCWLKD